VDALVTVVNCPPWGEFHAAVKNVRDTKMIVLVNGIIFFNTVSCQMHEFTKT